MTMMVLLPRNSLTSIVSVNFVSRRYSVRQISSSFLLPTTSISDHDGCCGFQRRVGPVTSVKAFASLHRPTMITTRNMSDSSKYPYHLVVGLPALSPTMEVGTISEWYKQVGDSFGAGDALAKIETDKAAMDFEAQDDGVVAKILINASDGTDIPVGTPIMITVEDAADVSAFQDYVVPATVPVAAVVTPAEVVAAPAPIAVATPPPPPPVVSSVVPAVTPQPPTPVPITPAPVVAAATTAAVTNASNNFSTALPGITYMNTKKSPLTYTLNLEQTKYIELYGTTGQSPIS